VAKLVLCGSIAFVWFPDDDPLQIKTCRDIQCDITICISKEQYYAFCWLSYAKYCQPHDLTHMKSALLMLQFQCIQEAYK
jgi:hypothetical protein